MIIIKIIFVIPYFFQTEHSKVKTLSLLNCDKIWLMAYSYYWIEFQSLKLLDKYQTSWQHKIFIGEKLIPKQWTLSYFPFWKRLSKGRLCIASLMSCCQGCRIIIIQKFNNWLQLFQDQSLIWISLGHTD